MSTTATNEIDKKKADRANIDGIHVKQTKNDRKKNRQNQLQV